MFSRIFPGRLTKSDSDCKPTNLSTVFHAIPQPQGHCVRPLPDDSRCWHDRGQPVAAGKISERPGGALYPRSAPAWSSGVAQEAMEKIGLPMEEELSTVRGIDSMNTTQLADPSARGHACGSSVILTWTSPTGRFATGWSGPPCVFPRALMIIGFSKYDAGACRRFAGMSHPLQRRHRPLCQSSRKHVIRPAATDRRRGGCQRADSSEGNPDRGGQGSRRGLRPEHPAGCPVGCEGDNFTLARAAP